MKKSTIYLAIIALLAIGLVVAAVVIFLAYGRPLNNSLRIDVKDVEEQVEAQVEALTAVVKVVELTGIPESTEALEPTKAPVVVETTEEKTRCGMSGRMNILVIGTDNNSWVKPSGADAIRLIKVDFDAQEILVYALPRDLLVDTPSYDSYGFESMRLGPLYYKVLKSDQAGDDPYYEAVNAVAQTIYDNFGVIVDHYVDIRSTEDLPDIVDQLGGVEVNVAEKFVDPESNLKISTGKQEMDGETALIYVRPRLGGLSKEWSRLDRQNEVVKGLFKKLSDPDIIDEIPSLYKKYSDTVATDLSIKQIVGLACTAQDLDFEDIQLKTIDKGDVTLESQGVITVNDPNALKNEIESYFMH